MPRGQLTRAELIERLAGVNDPVGASALAKLIALRDIFRDA